MKMPADIYSRSSRHDKNNRSSKISSRENSRDRRRTRNRGDEVNDRIDSLRSRKRTREQSPFSAPKRRRSRSAESPRRDRRGESARFDGREVSRSRRVERSRRCSREDRDDYRADSRRSRRESRYAENRSGRRAGSRDADRRNDDGYLERRRNDDPERTERYRDDEYDRRQERRGSDARDRSRNYKRSRSRSYRGNTKRNKVDSRKVVEDDEEGHLIFSRGDIIQDRYKIMSELGEGTFGKVVKCLDLSKNKTLAIKIIKNVKKYRDAAKLEINVLKKLADYDPECRYKCVQMYDWFDYHGHKCLVFQLLGKSVFDFLKDNNYEPYPLEHVRSMAYELCLSINFIHTHRLTHTDLKPENVLFYDSSKTKKCKKTKKEILCNPEIRLIDFGSATFDHEHHSSIIQTRHYRAPEVILKLGWNQSCDTWSVGCIIFELALGFMMFDTHSSLEHLAMIERIIGKVPSEMAIRSGSPYFKKGDLDWDVDSKEGRYVRRKVKGLERYIPREERENRDWKDMFDLIRGMLELDPAKRITLPQAMNHVFLERIALSRKASRSSSGYESR